MNKAASELGKLAAGKSKNFSAAELKLRTARLLKAAAAVRKRKRKVANGERSDARPRAFADANGSALDSQTKEKQ